MQGRQEGLHGDLHILFTVHASKPSGEESRYSVCAGVFVFVCVCVCVCVGECGLCGPVYHIHA